MSSQELGVFCYKANLTLQSPLTPQHVREQLSRAQPHFDLDTGCPNLHSRLFNRGRIFALRVGEGTFHVSGPLSRSEVPSSFGGLVVNGSVEGDKQGSLIHLTAENGGVHVAGLTGLVLIALLVCAVVVGSFSVMVILGVPSTFLGFMFYVRCSMRSRALLKPLVLCLAKMLSAQ